MRYSVSIDGPLDPGFGQKVAEWERAGVGGMWCADHLGHLDPIVPLAAAAMTTSTMRLGQLVINHDFWHPALLARSVGTLAQLAPGRTVFGVGAGHAEVEYQQLGIDYPRPGLRIDRMTALIDASVRLLAGETETCSTPWFDLVDCALAAATPPTPPLLAIGGNGDRIMKLGAAIADIVGITGFTSGTGKRHNNLSHFSWEGLANRLSLIRASALRPVEINLLVQQVLVTDDPGSELEPMAGRTNLALEDLLDNPFVLVGSANNIRERLSRLEHELHVGDVTVFEPSLAGLLSVIG